MAPDLVQPVLIRGLPNDISISCLARLPRKYHALLSCVSRTWRDLVCSEAFRMYRRKHFLHEAWIYALCRDKLGKVQFYVLDPSSSRRSWKLIESLPPRISNRNGMVFEAFGNKVYFLGGCGWCIDVTDEVYCYNVSLNAWTEGTRLSTPRCYFACEVMGEKIYALGGFGLKSGDTNSWDTYDPLTDSCKSHPGAHTLHDIEDSVVLDGKIYIRCGSSALTCYTYVLVFDPSRETWEHADTDLVSGWQGPAAVIDETLYVLDQNSGTRLTKWDKNNRKWVAVGRLSPMLTRPPCRMVGIGNTLYVIGKGLSTVAIDVSKAMRDVMVTSSIPSFSSDIDVASCKFLAI